MRILGLDPGTATTGYGVIEATDGRLSAVIYGVITTPAHVEAAHRLQHIYQAIEELLNVYRPDAAAVEEVFFGRNITTAIAVGQARGVLLLALANAHLPIAEYSPPQVKDTVTGYGKADKNQVQMMVQNLLNLDTLPQPDDAADGLAVAITHYYHQRHLSLAEVQYSR
ncbi:MAG: crossover junction endodeoxyribonuclease RuvC [Chloroflexota bacterium]